MKRILLVFMVIGLGTTISATPPKYAGVENIKPAGIQENYLPQTNFTLSLVNYYGSVKYDIVLTNTFMGTPYGPYTVNDDSNRHESIPKGTYDIQITPETNAYKLLRSG